MQPRLRGVEGRAGIATCWRCDDGHSLCNWLLLCSPALVAQLQLKQKVAQ
jgi:hypothetical protein